MRETFVYLRPGIEFFESVHPGLFAGGIATLTLGARDLGTLARPLRAVLEPLGSVVRWHSIGHDRWPNRLHPILAAKQMAGDLPGFSGTTAHEVGGVLTNATRLIPPLSARHLELSNYPQLTILLIGPPTEVDPSRIGELMAPWARGLTEESILACATSRPRLFLLRIYSHRDFVSAAQLFGDLRALEQCRVELARTGAAELEDESAVASWLRGEL